MMKRLSGKTALVTGASRGIGRGVALFMAEEGANVVINYRSHPDEAAEVVELIEQLGQRAVAWQADVSARNEVARMISATVEQFGHLDIVVANAATETRGPLLESNWDDDLRTFEVNQFGTFHTCKLGAQQMLRQTTDGNVGGKIIIVSSVCAEVVPLQQAAYNVSKAAASHLGRVLARELIPHHINVNIVSPGWIDTPGERSMFGDEIVDTAGRHVPWGRIGQPEDVAKAVVFLASEDADFITGSTLVIDGGQQLLSGDLDPENPPTNQG